MENRNEIEMKGDNELGMQLVETWTKAKALFASFF